MPPRRRGRSASKTAEKLLRFLVTFVIVTVGLLLLYSTVLKDRPQDLPWTELRLDQPIGYFTGRKITALDGDYEKCQALLGETEMAYRPFPASGEGECRRLENISLLAPPTGKLNYVPKPLAPSCPVAAALAIWEEQVVQPAALKHFGQRVSEVRHLGSYSCRPIAGTDQWSEHATANAIDIAGFNLADGQKISLIIDWSGNEEQTAFLRDVRDGACDLFSTVLSPDYNAAHADHFHFDQASRGAMGYRVCR